MSATTISPPSAEEVFGLMQGLFGLEIKACPVDDSDPYSIAEYVDESGAAVGYVACDLDGGCRLGAALTQVPAGRVDEAVSEGAMPDNLAENLNEVFNISVTLMAAEDGSRVVLGRVAHGPAAGLFAEFRANLEAASKTQYAFDVARYGVCRLVVGN